MYPVHFSISNISCLLITSEKSLFLTFIKVYNIIHEAQINTMDINFDHTYTQCLGIHIYTFTKTSNECKLISLEIFFFGRGWFGGDALDTDMQTGGTYIPPLRLSCPPFHSLGPGYRPTRCGCSIHFLSNGRNHSSLQKQKKNCYYLP